MGVRSGVLYKLADAPTQGEVDALDCKPRDIRAMITGENRPPKAGEWYVSGAIPEAYRAPNDLKQHHWIARLFATSLIRRPIGR